MNFKSTILNWTGTDEELLVSLNTPKNKRKVNDGLVSLAMVAAESQELAGLLAVTMKRVIAGLAATLDQLPDGPQRDQVEGQFEIFDSFFKRLKESSYGAPIDSDSFRNQFSGVATQAGWTAEQIEDFLSLGAVVTSDAIDELGRNATQADIDQIRQANAEALDLQSRQDALDAVQAKTFQAFEAAQAVFRSGGTITQIQEAANASWETE